MTNAMENELIPCGKGYIRTGIHNNNKRGYVLMDVLGFVITASKASTVSNRLPNACSFRSSVEGIPGRPNILVTLKGIEGILKLYPTLTEDLQNFILVEQQRIDAFELTEQQVEVPLIEDIEDKSSALYTDIQIIKINKRLKKIEKMLTVIYEELK